MSTAAGGQAVELAGRVALVTGGARGQGRSHAAALAAAGATVVVADIAGPVASVGYPLASAAELDDTVAGIRAGGGRAEAAVCDVRDGPAVGALVDGIVAAHGRLDVLVANAGICGFGAVDTLTDEEWADTIATNLSGVFHCVRAAVPPMRAAGFGRIVAISSGAGRAGMATLAHYSASKWGVIGLIKSVALETARDGITANVVCPTTVRTPMVCNDSTYRTFRPDLAAPGPDDVVPALARMSPMGVPWLEPQDVTRTVLHLVTDPGVISGAVLDVNLATSAGRT
jgi:NAD(P)-dependent dehydrogenase (short-subunit alcohol dehydrogenase family)